MAARRDAVLSLGPSLRSALDDYLVWLDKQPLADRSRDAYRAQVESFLVWLDDIEDPAEALSVAHRRDWAVRDYKRFLKNKRRLSPATVNQALAALDNFYRFRAVGRPVVAREQRTEVAPRALDQAEQRLLLRTVERWPRARDRAIVTLFLYVGLRLSELASLDVDDVALSARKGIVKVRSGKGDRYRTVPLNSTCRSALTDCVKERATVVARGGVDTEALWLSRYRRRMSGRAVGHVIERLASEAALKGLSPHVLRHTFVTNLIRSGVDVVLVAELAGHRRLD